MKVRALESPLAGEFLVAVDPAIAPTVEAGWNRRLYFHAGRTLSDRALTAEQEARAGRLATVGQYVSPGVVQGLDAELVPGETRGDWFVEVSAGIGVAVSGEDVVLSRPMRARVPDDLPILIEADREPTDGLGTRIRGDDLPPGIQIIESNEIASMERMAVLEMISSEYLEIYGGELTDAQVFILILQPVVLDAVPQDLCAPFDPCEQDPSAYAFEDWQRVDGCRLALYPWPTAWLGQARVHERWRNELSYAIFDEERRLGPGEVMPWALYGVPIALVGLPTLEERFSDLAFLDRAAVRRAGGHAGPRHELMQQSGSPYLWQARFEQNVDHVAATGTATFVERGISAIMRYLPPVGVLPPDALQVRGVEPADDDPLDPLPPDTADFLPADSVFPPAFRIAAAPMLLESLDDVVTASASLAPIDTIQHETVEVLVPVPQAWYEPRLLIVERVDQAFHDAIAEYEARELAEMIVQRQLWDTIVLNRTRLDETTLDLPEGYLDPLPAAPDDLPEEDQFDKEGGEALVDLAAKIAEILPWLSMQRLFQSMLPDDDPRRDEDVATWEVSNGIDPLAENFFGGLKRFIELLDQKLATAEDKVELGYYRLRTDLHRIRQQVVGNVVGTRFATSPVLADLSRNIVAQPTVTNLDSFGVGLETPEAVAVDQNLAPQVPPPSPVIVSLLTTPYNVAPINVAGGLALRFAPGAVAPDPDIRVEQPIAVADPQVVNLAAATAAASTAELDSTAHFGDVTLTARLDYPPSVETAEFSKTNKATIIDSARTIHGSGLDLSGTSYPGLAAEGANTAITDISASTVEQIRTGTYDRPTATDEAGFFSAGIRSIEHTVVALRNIGSRVELYKEVLAATRVTYRVLQGLIGKAYGRLEVVADDLEEIRHDLSVALALLDEERQRLRAINRRRREIIDEHVPYLVFRRPRTREALYDRPVRLMQPGIMPNPIPECLSSEFEAPEALRSMVDLMREAPITWFTHLPKLVNRLNRIDAIQVLLQHAQKRAAAPAMPVIAPIASTALADAKGQRIQSFYTTQTTVLHQVRQTTAQLVPQAYTTWQGARTEAEKTTTLSDLIDARHGRQDVARGAAKELEDIYRVTACLYTRFRDIPPVLRLKWSDDISQFDDTVDMRDLSVLESWSEAGDLLERYEMQALVDWLYGRVNADQPRALTLMHEIIRVALLSASHAPVHQLITSDLVEPQRAHVGTHIRLAVDITRVRVGMHVNLFAQAAQKAVAVGVVDDLGDGQAMVKVVRNDGTDPLVSQATLIEPDRAGFTFSAGGLLAR